MARNLTLERRRTEARRRAREEEVAKPEASPEGDPLERMSMRRRLIDEVMRLTEPERTAVILRYFESLTYEEVAARQGASVTAVRTRVSRAMARLRERLDKQDGGRGAWAAMLMPLIGVERVAEPRKGALQPMTLASGVLTMSTQKLVLGAGAIAVLVLLAVTVLDPARPTTGGPNPSVPGDVAAGVAELEAPGRGDHGREPSPASVEVRGEPLFHAAFPARPDEVVGTLELHLRWSDGSAAAGVSAGIMPWGAEDAFLHKRVVSTNARGVGVVEQLAPGLVGVYPDRCIGGRADIVAGQTTTLEIEIPVGVTVRGTVRDPEGRTVGGAAVCLSNQGNTTEGVAVTMTGPDGRYEVRGVNDQRFLSARAPGFAPSPQVYAAGADGGEASIDLVLRSVGGTLTGSVRAADGIPFSGAKVRITGSAPPDWNPTGSGRHERGEPLPFDLRTDEHGRFVADRVGAGPVLVQVRAEGWAPWEEPTEVTGDSTQHLDIVLARGAVMEGTVTHADGTPADDAYVSQGSYGAFGSTRVRTDDDGSYHISGLPGGEVEIVATKHQRGETSATLALTPGSSTRWDAVLVEGITVRGHVVDEREEPLAQWLVGYTNEWGGWFYAARTNSEGAFTLRNVPKTAAALATGPPGVARTGPCVFLPDAWRELADLRIVVPDAVRHTASATLRLLVDGEPAPEDVQVFVRSMFPQSSRELYPDEDGRIAVTQLRPALYRLTASMAGRAHRTVSFKVAPNQAVDLGDLHLSEGGRVHLELLGNGAAEIERARVIDETGVAVSGIDMEEGEGTSPPLAPGPIRVQVAGSRVATQVVEGVVREGETTELLITLRPGTPRWVVVRTANGSTFPPVYTMRVFDAADQLVQRWDAPSKPSDGQPEVRLELRGLEVGPYRILIECVDGRRGEALATVATLESTEVAAATIVVE